VTCPPDLKASRTKGERHPADVLGRKGGAARAKSMTPGGAGGDRKKSCGRAVEETELSH
jgi:hypothetical protein